MKLHEKIAEGLADISGKVEDKVVATMVDREVNKRTTALVTVYDLLTRAKQDMYKTKKPDVAEVLDAKGKPIVAAGYSKAKLKEIKDAEEKIAKIEGAIIKAFEENDYSKLYELSKPT